MEENEIKEKKKLPSVQQSSYLLPILIAGMILLSILLGIILTKASLVETINGDATLSYLLDALYELVFIGVPLFLFMKFGKFDAKETFRLNPMSVKETILVCVIGIAVYIAGVFYTEFNYLIAEIITDVELPVVPPMVSLTDKLAGVFSIVLVAPVTEELVFRGAIMRGLEGKSKWFAIIITGLFFGLLHCSYYSFVQKIFAGIILCYIVYVTDSIYSSMIVHIINNGISVILELISENIMQTEDVATETIGEAPAVGLLISAVLYLFLAASITTGIIALIVLLKKMTGKPMQNGKYEYKCRLRESDPEEKKLSPVTICCIVVGMVLTVLWTVVNI